MELLTVPLATSMFLALAVSTTYTGVWKDSIRRVDDGEI
jgi:hypothetical protein